MIDDRPEAEAERLLLDDLEHWRTFLLRARSRAQGGQEAPVHIDHLTAAAMCIGNAAKKTDALLTALREARAREEQLQVGRDRWREDFRTVQAAMIEAQDRAEAVERERDTLRAQLAELKETKTT